MDVLASYLALIDPDYWDINECIDTKPNIERRSTFTQKNVECLSEQGYSKIFSFLHLDSLKVCRLVCRQWNEIISILFKQKTCFIIDGERYKWKFFTDASKTCHEYMTKSNSKFSLWSSMRIRKVSTDQLNFLIANYEFGHAVKHISHVELVECSLEWETLMGFLRNFENLESLEDFHCHYSMYQSWWTWWASWFQNKNALREKPRKVTTYVNEEFPLSTCSFWQLKKLRIVESETENSTTEAVVNILHSRTSVLDTIVVEIGKQTASIESPKRQAQYWSNIVSCLRLKAVKKLQIISPYKVHHGLSERFILYFSQWSSFPGSAFGDLIELTIHLDPIRLWKTFQYQFIPFLSTLKNLQKFSLKMITMRESQEFQLHLLAKAIPSSCELNLGIIMDDYGGLIAASRIQRAMSHEIYLQHLTTLHIAILTNTIVEARQLLPHDLQYKHVKELCFSTNLVTRSSFYTYNIDIVVRTYPYLSQLEICDGLPTTKSETVQTSGAIFVDDDMQAILQGLCLLEKLCLRVNMTFMTDFGMTGLWPAADSPKAKPRNSKVKDSFKTGHNFSNLKCLKHISLVGLGHLITDTTAFNSFKGHNYSLKRLLLQGTLTMTAAGKERLHTTLGKCGCKVEIRQTQ